jgi:SAM-dependent methyltransferase
MTNYDKLSEIYDRIFGERFYRDYERFIRKATGLRRGRLLDVACGTGRLGARFPEFEVVGVDRSRGMLGRAKKRGLITKRASIESFRVPGAFDLAACTFDSLNHLKSLSGVFRSVARALKPGGFFVFDINTPFKINAVCPSYRGRRFTIGDTEVFWLSESAPNRWTSRLTMFQRGRRYEETIEERAFSRRVIESALRSAGLSVAGVYSDLRFRPVEPTSERWFYVVRRNHGSGNSRQGRRRSRLQ